MEEKSSLQIELFTQIHQLNKNDFVQFNQLVKKQQFVDSKLSYNCINEQKEIVINVLLYYIISIQKNFKVFKDDKFGQTYRTLCIKQISPYYIKNRMNIQLYQFSNITAKALSMKIQQCAHIIYYLVYGRFASHPYINTLCNKHFYDLKKKMFKKQRQIFDNTKISKKRTLNQVKNATQIQMQMFRKQLKNALKYENNNNLLWKKQNGDRKIDMEKKKKQKQGDQTLHATERNNLNRGHIYNTFIPQRITQGQNSSIIENSQFHRNLYQTCTDWNKKGLMRKQKFNQYFDINEIKTRNKLRKSPSSYFQENKQNLGRSIYNSSNEGEEGLGKINYESFKSISNDLKVKNFSLDKIRYECAIRNHKMGLEKQNENTFECFVKGNQTTKQNVLILKQVKNGCKQGKFISKNEQNIVNNDPQLMENISLRKNFTAAEACGSKNLKLARYLSYQPQISAQIINLDVQSEENGQRQEQYATNLLRNDQSTKNRQSQESKKLDYFSQTTGGFRKINCKYKLQKYKSDYRKFMKTQLLDRIRQAS